MRNLGRSAVMLFSPTPSIVNCTWKFYTQPVDHFGNSPGTFQQRVCQYSEFWRGGDAPIFFYTGNESPVEEYVNNTGLMWELGKKKKALLVWAEHRYEPATHPSLEGTPNCFAFGTTAQALQDYVQLIQTIRTEHSLPEAAPVISFGGSYGGMLSGWMRIKYPHILAGAIAGSAPVWGLATTLKSERLDWSARAIARGVSKAGGATDTCLANMRAAWPLLTQIGRSKVGLRLMSEAAKACAPETVTSVGEIISWAKRPWFDMAEGDYPYPSTYITYAVGPGYIPLPAWPMRVACARGLDADLGVTFDGSIEDVRYNVQIAKPSRDDGGDGGGDGGGLGVRVDWNVSEPIGWQPADLNEADVRASGVLELVAALTDAVGVWYNLTGTKTCYGIDYEQDAPIGRRQSLLHVASGRSTLPREPVPPISPAHSVEVMPAETASDYAPPCATCPPCDDCPQCPVASCHPGTCSYDSPLSKTFSWRTVTCNEDLNLYNLAVHGLGRDWSWPPSVYPRHVPTIDEIVGPHTKRTGCGNYEAREGLAGGPLEADPWAGWLSKYYHGPDLSAASNIVWSNGLLDPWSGGGVYPPGGGIDGPMVQNITADGSQIALLIADGAHHLDLFFSRPGEDPQSVVSARQIEERMIDTWAAEWRAEHAQ